jgi:heat shock protein beta
LRRPSSRKSSTEYIDESLRGRVEHLFSDGQQAALLSRAEKYEYQAEISRLMSILVDSLYQNKDIFMREVISNANDALDKIRFSALRNHSVLDGGPADLEVLIDVDEDERTLSITDTGIGMSQRDLVEKLGTIAKSGTDDFQRLLQSGDRRSPRETRPVDPAQVHAGDRNLHKLGVHREPREVDPGANGP